MLLVKAPIPAHVLALIDTDDSWIFFDTIDVMLLRKVCWLGIALNAVRRRTRLICKHRRISLVLVVSKSVLLGNRIFQLKFIRIYVCHFRPAFQK